MATENLKSTPVTNLDATPPVRTTSGKGADGILRQKDGTVTGTTAMEAASTYALVRVPTNVIVKHVWACLDASVTNFQADIGVYYGTGQDTPVDLRGDAIDADFFASAVDFDSVVVPTQYTMESAVYTVPDMFKPLWDAVGLSADPGGSFDIVFTSTETTDGAPVMYCAVEYVLPGA